MLKVSVEIKGDGDKFFGIIDWLGKKSKKTLGKSIRKEAIFLAKELKKELRSGGNPKFSAVSPFTRAIRRAQGIRSRRPGISEGNVLKSIKAKRISGLEHFTGVDVNTKKPRASGGSVDVFKSAKALELGRPSTVLDLDKPSSKTGKTPRQWLWWLYLNGALNNPPNKAKTHLILGGSPPRPFAENVFKREGKLAGKKIMKFFEEELIKEAKPKKLKG